MAVTGTEISGNTANRAGGGIENTAGDEEGDGTFLTDVTITGNDAGTPPATAAASTAVAPSWSRSSAAWSQGNTAVEGGGLWNSGAGSHHGPTTNVSDNTASRGGGVYQSGMGGMMSVSRASSRSTRPPPTVAAARSKAGRSR